MSDSIETHNLEDLSPVEIDTVMTTKSRLPEFDRSDPELCRQRSPLILDPPSPQPYTILRREIMNRLSLSDSQRIQRLFQGETLGDQSPSQFLRHLQVLMGDNTVGEAVLKQGWVQALPCYVQHCLDAQDPETSLSHLARIADRIMEEVLPTGPGTINHTQKVESAKDPVIEGLVASVKSLTEAVTRMQRVIETGAGHHNDHDPSHKTGHKCPDNLGSFVGTTGSLVSTQPSACNHAPGLSIILRQRGNE
ncbi:LOW QUALITY PROTEIN: hypothetical protein Smp_174560 [Schistosoma mansoni]|uniref:hypothetical protein n=1 Tax=Schistosoma mansoni TaxID=6183 RepID=UPI00022DC028|nr:LOW QUALITY PROTEIN: hypothetical protein Smp_174560 [Schistosoma mansoni]|eukprot:XP_018651247.1 LOW QUALITY PROTEIN: hypothetical protein Smp_174560 [Schistosoma mansoni]